MRANQALVVTAFWVLAWAVSDSAPSMSAQPVDNANANSPEPPALTLAEKVLALRTDLASREPAVVAAAERDLERLCDRHTLAELEPHLTPMKRELMPHLVRLGTRLLAALTAVDVAHPWFKKIAAAPIPITSGMLLIRRRDRPVLEWVQVGDLEPGQPGTVVATIDLDWRDRGYTRTAEAPTPGERVELGALAKSTALEATTWRRPVRHAPGADAQLQQGHDAFAAAVMLAVSAERTGRRVIAGDLLQAAWWLHQQLTASDRSPADADFTMTADFKQAMQDVVALRLVSRLVHRHADGVPVAETATALKSLVDTLQPTARRDVIADLTAALRRQLEFLPRGPRPDTKPALAGWLIAGLADLRLPLTEPLGVDCNAFAGQAPELWELWALNVHAIPLLIESLKDRRLTRTLVPLPLDGGVPHVLRVADLAYYVLVRLTGQRFGGADDHEPYLPTLNHDEPLIAVRAAAWWRRFEAKDELAFLQSRVTDAQNSDRIRLLPRIVDLDRAKAIELFHALADLDTELETALVDRLIELDYENRKDWVSAKVVSAKRASTRQLAARALWDRERIPGGAPQVMIDLAAGKFSAATLDSTVGWLREVAQARPDVVGAADVDTLLAKLLVAETVLTPVQRLAVVRHVAGQVPCAPVVAALKTMVEDRRTVWLVDGSEAVEGLFLARWRDLAAQGLAGLTKTELAGLWAPTAAERDVAVAELLDRLTGETRRVATEALPVVPLTVEQAAERVAAALKANETEREAAVAACIAGLPAVWQEIRRLVGRGGSGANAEAARLADLVRQVANGIRRVRVLTQGTPTDQLRSNVESMVVNIREQAQTMQGQAFELGRVLELLTADLSTVGWSSVELVAARLPNGGGVALDVVIGLNESAPTTEPACVVRAAVAVNGKAVAKRHVGIHGRPEHDVLTLLLAPIATAIATAQQQPADARWEFRASLIRLR